VDAFCDAIAEPVVSVKFIAQKHYKDKRSQSLSNVQEKEGLKMDGREGTSTMKLLRARNVQESWCCKLSSVQ
jgi:murein L,D-transpeptidase YcbB/YkuD